MLLPTHLLGRQPEDLASDPTTFDPELYKKNARIAESSNDDTAVNPDTTATGRYQFLKSTWNNLMEKNPDAGLTADGRTNGDQQEIAMDLLIAENQTNLESKGIPVTNGNMHVMHTLGAGKGSRVLLAAQKGNVKPAAELVGDLVVKKNPTWFKDKPTSQELVDLLAGKVEGFPSTDDVITAGVPPVKSFKLGLDDFED